eukprot:2983051-Amphidinium_carterae.1
MICKVHVLLGCVELYIATTTSTLPVTCCWQLATCNLQGNDGSNNEVCVSCWKFQFPHEETLGAKYVPACLAKQAHQLRADPT